MFPVQCDVTERFSPVSNVSLDNPVEPMYNVAGIDCISSSCYRGSSLYADYKGNVGGSFIPPPSERGRVVEIMEDCTRGDCSCENLVGGLHCSLKPCRVGEFLFNGSCCLPESWVTAIWNGLCDGFKIVDEDFSSSYDCENYLSITQSHFRNEMSNLLLE